MSGLPNLKTLENNAAVLVFHLPFGAVNLSPPRRGRRSFYGLVPSAPVVEEHEPLAEVLHDP